MRIFPRSEWASSASAKPRPEGDGIADTKSIIAPRIKAVEHIRNARGGLLEQQSTERPRLDRVAAGRVGGARPRRFWGQWAGAGFLHGDSGSANSVSGLWIPTPLTASNSNGPGLSGGLLANVSPGFASPRGSLLSIQLCNSATISRAACRACSMAPISKLIAPTLGCPPPP